MNPHHFTSLPVTISSFEKLNDSRVYYDNNITIGDDEFTLRSVVFVERNIIGKESIITGCSTGVRTIANSNRITNPTYKYDPLNVGSNMVNKQLKTWTPISVIPDEHNIEDNGETVSSFCNRAACTGTIFIYQKTTENVNKLLE